MKAIETAMIKAAILFGAARGANTLATKKIAPEARPKGSSASRAKRGNGFIHKVVRLADAHTLKLCSRASYLAFA